MEMPTQPGRRKLEVVQNGTNGPFPVVVEREAIQSAGST